MKCQVLFSLKKNNYKKFRMPCATILLSALLVNKNIACILIKSLVFYSFYDFKFSLCLSTMSGRATVAEIDWLQSLVTK